MLRMSHNVAFITGAAAGGLLVATFGPGWAFAVDAALYVVGAVLLARLPIARKARVAASNTLQELREGWSEFVSRTWVWVVVVVFAFSNAGFAAGFVTLGPIVADDTVGRAAWGSVLAAQAAGMVVGGLVAMRSRWDRPLYVGMATMLLTTPLMFALGLRPGVALLLGAAFLSGIGMETFAVAWDVALQSNVPEDRLSRVYAYDWFGSLVFIPLGQIAAGPVTSVAGLSATIVGCGALMLMATLAALLVPSIRGLRRAGAPEPAAATV
jgi:predicted MFS family arabinose efflux permease